MFMHMDLPRNIKTFTDIYLSLLLCVYSSDWGHPCEGFDDLASPQHSILFKEGSSRAGAAKAHPDLGWIRLL